jgi:predicted RNase H-like HicB family nuclease
MRYPILIEPGNDNSAFGVVVPDLPGCFSAGDTLEEALDAAKEAASAWIDATLDAGGTIPAPSALSALTALPDYAGWTVGIIDLDDVVADDTIERVNITLPRRVLRRLDDLAAARHKSRGGLITELTLHAHELGVIAPR